MPTPTRKAQPRKRPGGRSARVRSAVLRATLEELAAVGYASFSLESVAARAGVNKTTVYRRWGNREQLILDAMLERGSERVPIPDTGSLRQDLLELATAIADSITAPEVEATARAAASIGDPDSLLVDAARRFWETRLKMAREIVERAIARGELSPGTDPAAMIEALIGPIYFRLLMTREPLDKPFVEKLVDVVAG
jgi:AcrR family transcriptional regulator